MRVEQRVGMGFGYDREGSTGFEVISSWVRPVKVGMIFIIHLNLYPF